jgi:hypothetical protein
LSSTSSTLTLLDMLIQCSAGALAREKSGNCFLPSRHLSQGFVRSLE